MNRTVYGPERKPLGHPATTRLLARLRDEDPDEAERRIADENQKVFDRAILNWFRSTEGLK